MMDEANTTEQTERLSFNALLLGISIGTGHKQTNAALKEALAKESYNRGILLNAHQADGLDYYSRFETAITAGMYDLWLRYAPDIYRLYYDLTDKATSPAAQVFGHFGKRAMRHDLLLLQPRLVVSSFPTLAALVMQSKPPEQRFLNVLILTDYRVHYHWARPEADLICVPTQATAQQMLDCGIAADKLAVTGIPIDARYSSLAKQTAQQRRQLRRKHGLEPHIPVILISGGGTGKYHALDSVLQLLGNLGQRVQVLVLAGAKQQGRHSAGGATFHEIGFTSNFPELLATADLVVGKAGGLTVAEASALGVPMIIYKPIPGQEHHNAAFLQQQGAALYADSLCQLRSMIMATLEPQQHAALSQAALALGKADAAEQVNKVIWQRLPCFP